MITRTGFTRKLLAWYDRARRDLPWRADRAAGRAPEPWHVLISEAMLQQTQVATVIPYYQRFIARFPTVADLALADEQDVLRMWQGLGYYSRARNLHACARILHERHGGKLPSRTADLMMLPGIGRYTAGAVASIAFNRRAPILDGNVQRVLCRLDAIQADPRDRNVNASLWRRAQEILPRNRVGDFNSALMELGATICTPRSPQCLLCPVSANCEAFAAGLQEKIPPPRKAPPTPLVHRWVYCIHRKGEWLLEQRPPSGRWAGMWQFITTDAAACDGRRVELPVRTSAPKLLGRISHALTHRRYEFEVFTCTGLGELQPGGETRRRWLALGRLDEVPLTTPHLRIAGMLKDLV